MYALSVLYICATCKSTLHKCKGIGNMPVADYAIVIIVMGRKLRLGTHRKNEERKRQRTRVQSIGRPCKYKMLQPTEDCSFAHQVH